MNKKTMLVPLLLLSLLVINIMDRTWQSENSILTFNEEISGNLIEGNTYLPNKDTLIPTSSNITDTNKILRWGVSRKGEGLSPEPDPGSSALIEKYGGKYIGDINEKSIYLTFDEGYENGFTGKILDILKKTTVKATFFVTGPYIKDNPELINRMIEEGHEVGNHTVHHPSLPTISNSKIQTELIDLDKMFFDLTGKHMKFFRGPKGEYNERTLAITQQLGYKNLFWSFAYDDWYRDKSRGSKYAYDIFMRNLHNGSIILLHAVSKDNCDALEKIIIDTRDKGYTFEDINTLFKE